MIVVHRIQFLRDTVYNNNNKLCGRPPQYVPAPMQVDLWSDVRVMCEVGYLCANFSLPRPLYSRLRPDVRDRQTDWRQTDARRASSLNAPYHMGGAIIIYNFRNVRVQKRMQNCSKAISKMTIIVYSVLSACHTHATNDWQQIGMAKRR